MAPNSAHADAHRVIKRTVNKRGQVCRPRGQSKPSFASSAAAAPTSVAPAPSSAAPAPPAPSSAEAAPSPVADQAAAWTQPSPSPVSNDNNDNNNNNNDDNNNGGSATWGVLAVTDGTCGWSGADDTHPNGAEDWLNCGLNGGGWTPPHVTIDQLVAAELDASGVFSPCGDFIGKFKQYGGEFNVHPIMLASFAMQESTCNPGATGGNGEAGLMQISPPNCEAGNK